MNETTFVPVNVMESLKYPVRVSHNQFGRCEVLGVYRNTVPKTYTTYGPKREPRIMPNPAFRILLRVKTGTGDIRYIAPENCEGQKEMVEL